MPVPGVDFVPASEGTAQPGPVPMDQLLKLNSDRLQDFNKAMRECQFVEKIEVQNSEIRGRRGNLEKLRFTFFEYIILTKPDRPL